MPEHAATTPAPTMGAILVAGGRGTRAGFDKGFALLGGHPVLAHSVRAFAACRRTGAIVIVTREDARPAAEQIGTLAGDLFLGVVCGGERRQDSVWNGVQALVKARPDIGEIAVHDAARPLVRVVDIERCHDAALCDGGAVCAAPATETLRRATHDGWLEDGLSRDGIWLMQTPQIFRTAVLYTAMERLVASGCVATDEAGAVLAVGGCVRVVETPRWNLKITWPGDLETAERLLSTSRKEEEE